MNSSKNRRPQRATAPRVASSWIICAGSGLLLVFAFAPLTWAWCGWVALIPSWWSLRNSSPVQQQPIRHGYGVGLIFIAGCFWWVGTAAPLGFIIMLGVLSFYPALWFLLVARLLPVREPGPFRFLRLLGTVLLASAFWVSLEETRSWFLTGFNWNELGVSQTPNPAIRQLAALGGVPLLSFVLVIFNILLAETIQALGHRQKDRLKSAAPPLLVAILLLMSCWLYGRYHLQRHQNKAATHLISYACIQPNIAQIPYATITPWDIPQREIDAYQALEKLSAIAIRGKPDLLIWPEAITAQRLGLDLLVGKTVADMQRHVPDDFLFGAEEYTQGKLYNGAYVATASGTSRQTYRKRHLVVLAEHLPWSDEFPWLLKLGGGVDFSPGDRSVAFTMSRGGVTFTPFICFEETQPGLVRDAALLHPDFFITLTDDDWYSGLAAEWIVSQQLQNALLRTVEYDRPMIRCANNGISCEIDPSGDVVARVQSDRGETAEVQGILVRNLILRPAQVTSYNYWGDWVGLLSQMATVLGGILYLFKSYKQMTIRLLSAFLH
jgi:apolipoprotein N-acyltransferase